MPKMTKYGVDEYALEDLKALAELENISLEEAVKRHGWQDDFSELAEAVRVAHPTTFAEAEIRTDGVIGAIIRFRGPVPDGVAEMFTDARYDVELIGGALLTEAQMQRMVAMVARSLGKDNEGFSVIPDLEQGTITALVAGIDRATAARLQAMAQKELEAAGGSGMSAPRVIVHAVAGSGPQDEGE